MVGASMEEWQVERHSRTTNLAMGRSIIWAINLVAHRARSVMLRSSLKDTGSGPVLSMVWGLGLVDLKDCHCMKGGSTLTIHGIHSSREGKCSPARLTHYLHCTRLQRITAPMRPPELIVAILVNACVYTGRAVARFRSIPEVPLRAASLKNRCMVYFRWMPRPSRTVQMQNPPAYRHCM